MSTIYADCPVCGEEVGSAHMVDDDGTCEWCDELLKNDLFKCVNCGGAVKNRRCVDCDMPARLMGSIDLALPLCDICRRRHGYEVIHACE